MPTTHLDLILLLMQNNTDNKEKQSGMLEFYYDAFDVNTKHAIDIIMMSVCGYSLDTILKNPETIPNDDKK